MGRCRFVQPDTVRLPLSDGDFIDVKRELNSWERRRILSSLVNTGLGFGEKPTLNPQLVGKTRIVEYLLGWSFIDAEGRPVPVSESALDSLDMDTYAEVSAAIDAHEERGDQLREAKKKPPAGESASSATSPLPSTSAGATETS